MVDVIPERSPEVGWAADLFHRLMKHKGGRFAAEPFDPASLADMMFQAERNLAEQFLAAMKEFTGSSIHFDYIHSSELNAVAFSDLSSGREFIGVNAATVFMLRQVFYVLLCQPAILPQVGDPSDEKASENTFLPVIELMLGENEFRFPNDETRRKFATTLAQLAFWHLVAHEHAHHSHGHVLFLQNKRGEPFLFEINTSKAVTDPEYVLVRQTLEYDADCAAVQRSLKAVLNSSKVYEKADYDGRWDNAYAGEEVGLYSWGFAITILFLLMGRDEMFDHDIANAYHPPPRMRQSISFLTAHHALGAWGRTDLQEGFNAICYKSQRDAEEGFAEITGTPRKKDLLRKVFDDLAQERTSYLAALNAKWAELYPQLKKYARVPIHDPATDGDSGTPSR